MTNWIDPLLRDTFNGRADAPPGTSCLAAETAAALADDGLPAEERARAEAHVSDCARCQALLAALVTVTPHVASRAWWRRPAVAWLVPAAVAAAAFIVWINMPPRATVTPGVPAAIDNRHRAEADPIPAAPPAGAPPWAFSPPPAVSTQPPVQARSAAPASAADRQGESAVLKMETPGTIAPPEPPGQQVPLPSATLQLDAAAPQGLPVVTSEARRQAAGNAAATPEASAGGSTAMFADNSLAAMARRAEAAPRTIVSSDSMSRWRIDMSGVVQHSADSGATWQPQSTGMNVMFTAGSSPSRAVCWLVGAGGIVLMTADEGRSWERVPFPDAGDLVSIRATDDRTAVVVTADRRTFRTSDRGLHWSR